MSFMGTLTIEIKNPKARKLIEDLIDLDLISIKTSWPDLWNKLESKLPQNEPEMSEDEILEEIKAFRRERKSGV